MWKNFKCPICPTKFCLFFPIPFFSFPGLPGAIRWYVIKRHHSTAEAGPFMMTSSNGKHFPRYWPFVRGINRSPVNSSYKGQWRGALMFDLICCTWIKGRLINGEAGDWRRHRAHYHNLKFQSNLDEVSCQTKMKKINFVFGIHKTDHHFNRIVWYAYFLMQNIVLA